MRRIVTYRPAGDERAVVPRPEGRSKERIWLRELGQYLHHPMAALRKFGHREGLVRKCGMGCGRQGLEYVSPYGAMRIIAYCRAVQGEHYLRGKFFHEFNESQALRKLLATHKRLAIAIEKDLQDAEGQPGACPIA